MLHPHERSVLCNMRFVMAVGISDRSQKSTMMSKLAKYVPSFPCNIRWNNLRLAGFSTSFSMTYPQRLRRDAITSNKLSRL